MTEFEKKQNPLAAFFRQPKIYITLPSKGQFYPPGTLDLTQTGEIPVFAMTARDELMFKTPDALMNGTSTVEVIKSCVPNIKDPWSMPSIDIDAVLCAIRMATYGNEMAMTSVCPACSNVNDLTLDLRRVLETFGNIQFNTSIVVDDVIVIKLRPLTYAEISTASLKAFEHQRIFAVINDEKLSEDEKIKIVQDSFLKLTDLTFDTVAESITSVETQHGTTSEKEFILEFLKNTDKNVFSEINKAIESSKKTTKVPDLDTECTECHHKYQVSFTLDQSDFFGKGF